MTPLPQSGQLKDKALTFSLQGNIGALRERCAEAHKDGILAGAAVGLATGMGYVLLAAIFFAIMCLFILILFLVGFGSGSENERELKITIPENLDYDGQFDDLFWQYLHSFRQERVKTSNMGTLYELDYWLVLKDDQVPKAFLDELRCRNRNLNIVCGRVASREAL